MFGSLVTIGAMLGAITSGRITDIIGRKGVMKISIFFEYMHFTIIGSFIINKP